MRNSCPLVSVIMPVFNCESTLSEAIDSIINQTYNNWELIICDDCSTDNSYAIMKKYQQNYSDKIVVIQNEKNSKIATTLNRCLDHVSGEYVARMDGDDRSKPERLETQVEFLNQHDDIDCVGAGREVFDETGIRGYYISNEYPQEENRFHGVPFAHPTIMMRTEIYKALGGYRVAPETLRAEDVDLWFRFWEKGFKGYNLQVVLLEYRESKDAMKKRTIKAGIGTSKVLLKYWHQENAGYKNFLLCFKPVLASIIPKSIMYRYHSRMMISAVEDIENDKARA